MKNVSCNSFEFNSTNGIFMENIRIFNRQSFKNLKSRRRISPHSFLEELLPQFFIQIDNCE